MCVSMYVYIYIYIYIYTYIHTHKIIWGKVDLSEGCCRVISFIYLASDIKFLNLKFCDYFIDKLWEVINVLWKFYLNLKNKLDLLLRWLFFIRRKKVCVCVCVYIYIYIYIYIYLQLWIETWDQFWWMFVAQSVSVFICLLSVSCKNVSLFMSHIK